MTADTTSTHLTKRTYLVQRLNRPSGTSPLVDAMAFGGGLLRGGMTKEAHDFLRVVFAFDYMGAAEFEWGAVPKALDRMVKATLVTHVFDIEHAEVNDWRKAHATGSSTIYVICPKKWEHEVEARFRQMAADELRLKESARVYEALLDPASRLIGWLELDNGWMAFADRSAWERTCDLLDLRTDQP